MRLHFLVASAALLSASLAAHASAININFNGLPGPDNSAFTTYTESGFTVTTTAGSFRKATGNVNNFGNPEPDVYTTSSGTLRVTDGGNLFSFTSLDLGSFFSGSSIGYTLTGLAGAVNVFTQTGTLSGFDLPETFLTLNSTFPTREISTLRIVINANNSGGANVDNIRLSTAAAPTPEPSSLLLLGTGIIGALGTMRKRFA